MYRSLDRDRCCPQKLICHGIMVASHRSSHLSRNDLSGNDSCVMNLFGNRRKRATNQPSTA
jgi:hypothetical protein